MSKFRITTLIVISVILFILTGCINKEKKDSLTMNKINVIIDNKKYSLDLESNETTKEFVKMLPKEFTMNELNGNEKYVYLDKELSTNSYEVKEIKKGDVMLFGDNCLVIFYKSFTTSYSYTKIGHINDLPDLGDKEIVILLKKD